MCILCFTFVVAVKPQDQGTLTLLRIEGTLLIPAGKDSMEEKHAALEALGSLEYAPYTTLRKLRVIIIE